MLQIYLVVRAGFEPAISDSKFGVLTIWLRCVVLICHSLGHLSMSLA